MFSFTRGVFAETVTYTGHRDVNICRTFVLEDRSANKTKCIHLQPKSNVLDIFFRNETRMRIFFSKMFLNLVLFTYELPVPRIDIIMIRYYLCTLDIMLWCYT